MQARVAWSVELGDGSWRKNEVELDETDLKRILIEADIPPDTQLSTGRAFQLLEVEAQRLLLAMMVTRYSTGMRSQDNLDQLNAYQTQKSSLLQVIRDSLPE